MKTGRSRKYYLMEAVLILFNILINLIIFAVPLAVNQIINGKLALTDRVIAFIIGFMLLEICIQFVYLLIELHMQKEYKKNLSKEIYHLFHEIRINHKVRCNVPDGAGRLDGAHIGESVYYVGPDTDCKITGYFVDSVILPDHQYFYFSGDAVYLDTQCGWILYPE